MENRSAFMKIDELYRDVSRKTVVTAKRQGGFAPRKPKVQPKSGSTCPTCFMKRSVSGLCDCNAYV